MPKILIVEDDSTLSMIVSETLARDGFTTACAANGEEGLHRFAKDGADLIVADVMMPRMDGFEMARRIRKADPRVPILFLTARSEIDDVVEGFEIGGNDYLRKPFRMLELIVRIKALLGRNVATQRSPLTIGAYTLNLDTQILQTAGRSCTLSHIEARLLDVLAANTGQTVEASTLMELVWQRDDPFSRNSLHGFIHKLRGYLRHDPSIAILNRRGIGYMLTVVNQEN